MMHPSYVLVKIPLYIAGSAVGVGVAPRSGVVTPGLLIFDGYVLIQQACCRPIALIKCW